MQSYHNRVNEGPLLIKKEVSVWKEPRLILVKHVRQERILVKSLHRYSHLNLNVGC